MLAISLVAGDNIAIDSSVRSALYSRLEKVFYEFYAASPSEASPNLQAAAGSIGNVSGVMAAEPAQSLGLPVQWIPPGSNEPHSYYSSITLLAVRPELDAHFDRLKVAGELPSGSEGVAINRWLAEVAQLTVGDALHLRAYGPIVDPNPLDNISIETNLFRHLNLTITSIIDIEQVPLSGFAQSCPVQPWMSSAQRGSEANPCLDFAWHSEVFNPVFIPLDAASVVFDRLLNFSSDLSALGLDPSQAQPVDWWVRDDVIILVDRDRFIFPASEAKTREALDRLRFLLEQAASPYGFVVYSSWALEMVVQDYGSQFLVTQIVFLAASFPVIALGAYLTAIGNELGLRERRREIGILKSRGCSSQQIFLLLLAETAILGIVAGILGLLVGVGVSRLVLENVLSFGLSQEVQADIVALYISPEAIVLAILFAVSVMLMVTYRGNRRLSNLSIRESLQQYSRAELALGYRPGRDIAMISVALFALIGLWFFSPEMVEGGGGGFLFIIVASTILVVIPSLAPVAPFLLIFGLTRLLTRYTTKVYDWASRVVRPLTPNLSHTVERNLSRHPRRASAVCLMIALALAFGLFIASTLETNEAHQRTLAYLQTGSDIRVEAYGPFGRLESANLSVLPDVARVATAWRPLSPISCSGDSYSCPYGGLPLVALEPTNYSSAVGLTEKYLSRSSVQDFRSLEKGAFVFLPMLPQLSHLREGDSISFQILLYSSNGTQYVPVLNYTLLGFYKQLPGLPGEDAAIIDLAPLQPLISSFPLGPSTVFFIDVKPHERVPQTAAAIRALPEAARGGLRIAVADEVLEEYLADPVYKSFGDFLMIEYGFAVAIISVGLGLIMFVAVLDREVELAGILARGASSGQIRTLLVAEALVLMVLGVGIGTGTGILAAFSFTEFFNGFIETGDPIAPARVFTLGPLTLSLLGVTALALLIAAWLSAQRAGRIRIPEILRIRGG